MESEKGRPFWLVGSTEQRGPSLYLFFDQLSGIVRGVEAIGSVPWGSSVALNLGFAVTAPTAALSFFR